MKKIRPVPDPERPGLVQGFCGDCPETGPRTLIQEHALLWWIGHNDGHKAVSRLK